jgi:hypothetical protein
VDVYWNQIIIWISIDDSLRPLPAILDTGHGHNLSIREGQLRKWSGASLKRIGELEIGHQRVVQYPPDGALKLHRASCRFIGANAATPPRGDVWTNYPMRRSSDRTELARFAKARGGFDECRFCCR